MADEQGPKTDEVPEVLESMKSPRLPGFRRPSGSKVIKDLMSKGTVSSEIRAEMRRAMGICKAIGIRIERAVDCERASGKVPTESEMSQILGYTLILSRLVDCQAKLEKEARLRFQGLSREQVSEKVRQLMEDQVMHLINESRRGSKAKRVERTGA